jgi:hypothetical protein
MNNKQRVRAALPPPRVGEGRWTNKSRAKSDAPHAVTIWATKVHDLLISCFQVLVPASFRHLLRRDVNCSGLSHQAWGGVAGVMRLGGLAVDFDVDKLKVHS